MISFTKYLVNVCLLIVISIRIVIPVPIFIGINSSRAIEGGGVSEANEHIQFFRDFLDAPVSSTRCQARGRLGQAPQVRHDGKGCLLTGL